MSACAGFKAAIAFTSSLTSPRKRRGKGGCRAHEGQDGMTSGAAGWSLGVRTHQNGPALGIIGRHAVSAMTSKNGRI